MAKSKRSPGKKSPAKSKAPAKTKAGAATKGDNVRMLAPKAAVKSFITEIIASKNETSTLGQEISSATKRAQNSGVNIPAARLAVRFVSKAKMDPAAARVMYEDFAYYLEECMEFDKLAPPGMFPADEVRSTKNGGKKKAAQADIEEKIADGTVNETATAVATADETHGSSEEVVVH